jgi:hypothetical protein
MMEILAGLEGSALAAALRGSKWIYPLINAGHIAGIALLFGTVVTFDLRAMGVWRTVPLDGLSRVLLPVAAAGLALAAGAGVLLFIVKATEYAASPVFQIKMAVLALAVANALAYFALARRHAWSAAATPTPPLRRSLAVASLALWLGVLVLGRLVAYF